MVPNSMLHSRRLIYPKTRLIREFLGGMIVDPLPFLMSFGVFGARHGFKRFRSNVGSPRFLRKSVMGRDRIQDLRLGKFSLLSPLRVMVVPWIILRHIRLHECSRYSAPAETCWLAKWHRRRCQFSLATAGSVGGLGRSGSVDGFLHSARLPFRAYCFDVIYGWPRVRLLSGLRSVHEDFFCRSYMDDRTFVTSTPGNLLGSVEAWEDWSLRVGLRESSSKAQLTASFGATSSCGSVGWAEAVVGSDFTVLGATSATGAPVVCLARMSER